MRVLITGHNGYIGSVLAPMVRAAGHDVVGLDTFLFEGERSAQTAQTLMHCEWICAMCRSPTCVGSTR